MSKKLELINKKIKDRLKVLEDYLKELDVELSKHKEKYKNYNGILTNNRVAEIIDITGNITRFSVEIKRIEYEKDFLNSLLIQQICPKQLKF